MLASRAQTRAKFPIPQFRFNCRLNAPPLFSLHPPFDGVILVFLILTSSSRHTSRPARSFDKGYFWFPAKRSAPPSCARRNLSKDKRTSIDRRETRVMKLDYISFERRTKNSILVQIYFSNLDNTWIFLLVILPLFSSWKKIDLYIYLSFVFKVSTILRWNLFIHLIHRKKSFHQSTALSNDNRN